MAVALDPSLVTPSSDAGVGVESRPGDACGRLRFRSGRSGGVRVVTPIDTERFHVLIERWLA